MPVTIFAGCTTDQTGETRHFVDDRSKLPAFVTCYRAYLLDPELSWPRIRRAIRATEHGGVRVCWDVNGTRYESPRLGRGVSNG